MKQNIEFTTENIVKDLNGNDSLIFPFGYDEKGKLSYITLQRNPFVYICGEAKSGKTNLIKTFLTSSIARLDKSKFIFVVISSKPCYEEFEDFPWGNIDVVGADDASINVISKKVMTLLDDFYIKIAHEYASDYIQYNEIAEKKNLPQLPEIVIIADGIESYSDKALKCLYNTTNKARAAGYKFIFACEGKPENKMIKKIMTNFNVKVESVTKTEGDDINYLVNVKAYDSLDHGVREYKNLNACKYDAERDYKFIK